MDIHETADIVAHVACCGKRLSLCWVSLLDDTVTLALTASRPDSRDILCLHRGEPLIWLFPLVEHFDLCHLEGNHVAAALLALAAHPPMLADPAAAALLALAAHPNVLADASTAALLANAALPSVLTDASTAALLAVAALPPVLADATAAALFALAAMPPMLA